MYLKQWRMHEQTHTYNIQLTTHACIWNNEGCTKHKIRKSITCTHIFTRASTWSNNGCMTDRIQAHTHTTIHTCKHLKQQRMHDGRIFKHMHLCTIQWEWQASSPDFKYTHKHTYTHTHNYPHVQAPVHNPVGVAGLQPRQQHFHVGFDVPGWQDYGAISNDRLQITLHKRQHLQAQTMVAPDLALEVRDVALKQREMACALLYASSCMTAINQTMLYERKKKGHLIGVHVLHDRHRSSPSKWTAVRTCMKKVHTV